jgi:hypothetical protein
MQAAGRVMQLLEAAYHNELPRIKKLLSRGVSARPRKSVRERERAREREKPRERERDREIETESARERERDPEPWTHNKPPRFK